MIRLSFNKLVSPAVAFSLVSSMVFPGTIAFGSGEGEKVNKKDDSATFGSGESKKVDKKEDSEKNVMSALDAIAIGDFIEKNNSLKKDEYGGKSSEGEDELNRSDIQKLYNIYMLKLLKKASEDKPSPKTLVGRIGNEIEDLGKNMKPIFVGVSVVLAAGTISLPLVLDFLERSGMSTKDALYFVFPERAASIAKVRETEIDVAKKQMEYDFEKDYYENHKFLYFFNKVGKDFVNSVAGLIGAIKFWGK